MRYASKSDGNQREIVLQLRQVGASVESLHRVGRDVPDLLVGFRGRNYVIEIKMPGERLTPGQAIWHNAWRGAVGVATTPDEALQIIGAIT